MKTTTLKHTARYAIRLNHVGVGTLTSPTGMPDPSCSACKPGSPSAHQSSILLELMAFPLWVFYSSCPCRTVAAPVLACSNCSYAHLLATTLRQDATCRGCNGVGDLSGGILEIGPLWHRPRRLWAIGPTGQYVMPISFCISSHSETSLQHCTGATAQGTRPDLVPGDPSLS
jgi:hypothetical protein